MTWGARRKLLYSVVGLGVVGSILGFTLYTFLSKEPTCFDGVMNGDERGIDCGGACDLLCREDMREPVVLWARSFAIAPGFYTAAAYVSNPNLRAKGVGARYVFKLFDEKNILVAERYGVVTIAAQQTVPIIEASIVTGNRIPVRTFFEFVGDISFKRESRALSVRVVDEILDEAGGRFEARLINDAREAVQALVVPVVLFDGEGNAQAASKSLISELSGGGDERVIFTWPAALPSVTRVEVMPYRAD